MDKKGCWIVFEEGSRGSKKMRCEGFTRMVLEINLFRTYKVKYYDVCICPDAIF